MILQLNPEKDAAYASGGNNTEGSAGKEVAVAAKSTSPRDKSYYLDLIRWQSQQMREMGFLSSLGVEEIARIEASLEKLPFDLLKAIARGGENLLRGK
jgi:hypothetical protein